MQLLRLLFGNAIHHALNRRRQSAAFLNRGAIAPLFATVQADSPSKLSPTGAYTIGTLFL
jgi:hypothetical protein